MYVNIKTEYNFLSSYATIDNIVKYAKKHDILAIGICDTETTFGNLKFYHKCIENNIKPIIGCELILNNQNYLLYAKNLAGMKRLNELNSAKNKDGHFVFNKSEPDLILVIGRGKIAEELIKHNNIDNIKKLNSIFVDLYFGVYSNLNDAKNYRLNQALANTQLKPLLIDQINYLDEADMDTYITLEAIKVTQKYADIKKLSPELKNNKIKSLDMIDTKYLKYFEEFNQLIDIKLPEKKMLPPKYPFLPDNKTADLYLTELCNRGLYKRCHGNIKVEYQKRLDYELATIIKMQYCDYFLIMWDIILYAKANDIYVGPGRGSAAGSLVSYCLGITELDPVASNLIFERFLNPERISMPDIDVDFEDTRRNDIVDYMIKRFGEEHVVKIATISKFQAKSAFRDVAKAWKVNQTLIDLIAKQLNSRMSFKENIVNNKKIQSEVLKDLTLKIVLDIVTKIEQLPRQTSIHAAGIILSEENINHYCSVNNEHVSEAEASDLEQLGLLKFDILSLSNLTFIRTIIEEINRHEHKFSLTDIKYNRPEVIKMIADGKTIGIFQLESPGMRATLRQIAPTSLKEVANALSLYRPGPREFIPLYTKNKKNFKINTEIDEILKDSYGIIVYQEQIILIATTMAGYSLGKADILRRSISKKDHETLESLKADFVKCSVENGYNLQYASDTYDLIAKFANYGFNKAHAYAYSLIAYQMAYLKYYYSDIFYGKLFYYNFKLQDKKDEFLAELERQNVTLLPPCILKSDIEVSTENGNLRMGLITIDSVGRDLAKQIISNRQLLSPAPTFEKTIVELFNSIVISDSTLDKMVDAGCFDSFNLNHNTLKHAIKNLIGSNAELIKTLMNDSYKLIIKEDTSFEELSQLEKKALSINIKYKYFEKVKENYEKKVNRPLYSIDKIFMLQEPNNLFQTYYCLFKIKSFKEITTKNGKKMCFLTVESEQIYEITVFSREYLQGIKTIESNLGNYVIGLVKLEEGQLYLKKI